MQPAFRDGKVFAAPTMLRDRVGPRLGRIDQDAVARAEAAHKGLASKFDAWLQEEVERLDRVRETVGVEGANRRNLDLLFTCAHDLKGLGATYGYPLIGRIAGSLCKLLGDGEARVRTPMALVDAHIKAIKAAVRDNIRDSDNLVGHALATELERHTADYLSGQA